MTNTKVTKIVSGLIGLATVFSMFAGIAASAQTTGYTFTTNLSLGSKGQSVWNLQKTLNWSADTQVALTGAGSPGNETSTFGPATKRAVMKFQAKYGISQTGTVGPITRAKLNSLSSTVVVTPGQPGTPVVVTTNGALNVMVANNPITGAFPTSATAGASQVPVLTLSFTAGATPVTVTGLNVYRSGISSDTDINNAYLKDGAAVVASNIGIGSGKIVFSQGSGLFTVQAGQTKIITVAIDLVGNPNHTYTFGINSAADITATGAIGGSFPIMGNSIYDVTVSNPALATLTLQNTGTAYNATPTGQVSAGTNSYLAGQFSIQAQNSAVSVKAIKLTQVGTINSATDLANVKLMNGSVVVGTAAGLNPDGTVTFDLSANPLQITAGQTVNLAVYTDVRSGVNRVFAFTVQRSYDISGTDMTYNIGAAVSIVSNGAFPLNLTNNQVQYGTLVINKDASSPSGYVAAGTTNVVLANFDLQANGEPVRITGLAFLAKWNGGSRVENMVINNLKLVDDQGVQIGTTYTSGTASVAQSQNVALTNLNYIIPANTTRHFYVKSDIISGTAATGIYATLSGVTGQGYTSLTAITQNGPYTGSTLNLNSTPLTASQNTALGSTTVVGGTNSVRIASFSLTAGPAAGANISAITLTTASGIAAKFQNLTVKVGSTQAGNVQGSLANTATGYAFTPSSPIAVPVGGSVVLDVYADVVSGAGTGAVNPVVQLTGVTAQDTNFNLLTTSNLPVNGQQVTISNGGTLTAAQASTPVTSQYVGMGVTGVKLASFKYSADNNEPLNVTQVVLNDTTNDTGNVTEFSNIRLMNGLTQVASLSSFGSVIAGQATTTYNIPTGTLVVPQNGNIQLDVVADVTTLNNGAVSGATHALTLGVTTYQGSSGTQNTTAGVASGTTITVYRTNLNVVAGSTVATPSIGDSAVVGQFDFSANIGNDALVKTISLKNAGGLIQSSSTVTVRFYDSTNPSVALGTLVLSGTTASTTATLNSGNGWTIPAGQKRTMIVKADLASATNLTPASSSAPVGSRSYQTQITATVWSDGTTSTINLDPSIVTPVVGQTSNL